MRAFSRWASFLSASRRALLCAALTAVASFGLVLGFGAAPPDLAMTMSSSASSSLSSSSLGPARQSLDALFGFGGGDDQVFVMATPDANNECCIITRVRVGQAARADGRRSAKAPTSKHF
ncbi:hypothetical protein AKJ09_06476 [Labilithrix luteola]|uniref:Uncharacterized protein n=1 Tax=Labilithrix luteola TaxID=1391654 RepID=A0A0K1Q260_9BACT|nr:hypothetical protein [Labilithrix luteola]AKU99812.1 hypothetical protein AKJ09_06476 [Labilithrix luteola]